MLRTLPELRWNILWTNFFIRLALDFYSLWDINDRFSEFVSTVSHFPQIWIININLHTTVLVILKIWGHYSSPGWWPGSRVPSWTNHSALWQPAANQSGRERLPDSPELLWFAPPGSWIPDGCRGQRDEGSKSVSSSVCSDIVSDNPRLTMAYYPHCQAKYCPRSLRPPHENFTRII